MIKFFKRQFHASSSFLVSARAERIRNLGIAAHIDAGKTTLTERMLYFAGVTRHVGEVHDGDTVMDFLRLERERGITIQSAATHFQWNEHRLNLIDTPGHIDFNIEVERALRVLDGAIILLDAVSGVEAQTETVWNQMNRYKIPRIAFINKMDREGADFEHCIAEMAASLRGHGHILPCQLPIIEQSPSTQNRNRLIGMVDLINGNFLRWSDDGKVMRRSDLAMLSQTDFKRANLYRRFLMETLCEVDDVFLEKFLESDPELIDASCIQSAIQRLVLNRNGLPVFCGSAYRNQGVQPLLDAAVQFLPSPHRSKADPLIVKSVAQDTFLGFVFKVIFDDKMGPLSFIRAYSGELNPRSLLLNTRTHKKQKVGRLMQLHANEYEDIGQIAAGDIVAITGLSDTQTGDTLISPINSLKNSSLEVIKVSPPVFMRALEPETASGQQQLVDAIEKLGVEDPSVQLIRDDENSQILVGGMGELHLEIALDRLQNHFKVKCKSGPLWISYREALSQISTLEYLANFSENIAGKQQNIRMRLKMESLGDASDDRENAPLVDNQVIIHISSSLSNNDCKWTNEALKSTIAKGVHSSLMCGPISNSPVYGVRVTISDIEISGDSLLVGLQQCAIKGTQQLMKMNSRGSLTSAPSAREIIENSSFSLLEPIMLAEISCPTDFTRKVATDITAQRQGIILTLGDHESTNETALYNTNISTSWMQSLAKLVGRDFSAMSIENRRHRIRARIPLEAMMGYSSVLRAITKGHGSYSMKYAGFRPMSREKSIETLLKMRGF